MRSLLLWVIGIPIPIIIILWLLTGHAWVPPRCASWLRCGPRQNV